MYTQEITRRHRTAFVIMLDRSASMQGRVRFGRMMMTKAEALAYTANTLVTELIDRCRRTDGVRNYYDIAIVGYGGDGVELLPEGEGFRSIEEFSRRAPLMSRIAFEEILPDGSVAMVEHSREQWVEPKAEGTTPMYEAMLRVRDLISEWCSREENRVSFPPIVINITDGEASDCSDAELLDICSQVRAVSTEDGNVLLLNIHITSSDALPSIIFPMADELLAVSRHARTLAECSSLMPDAFSEAIHSLKGAGAVPPYYGMGYNATVVELLSIINIGSRSITNMA